MGRIIKPPTDPLYPYPKARRKKGKAKGKIIGRAMLLEHFKKQGDYMRTLDLIEWEHGGSLEFRFCQFYRKPRGKNDDWVYGQRAGHMKIKTLYKLIKKAKTKPDYGSFKDTLDKVKI